MKNFHILWNEMVSRDLGCGVKQESRGLHWAIEWELLQLKNIIVMDMKGNIHMVQQKWSIAKTSISFSPLTLSVQAAEKQNSW